MNNLRRWAAAALITATLGACSGSGAVQVQVPGLQAYLTSLQSAGSAKTSIDTVKTETVVVQQTATDLQPYRCEFDATVKAWVVYYYSPSKQKSYVCRPKADKSVTVTEVTDATLVYQPGDQMDTTIDTTKVTVDASQATQTAVNQVTNNTTTNTTNTTVNNNVTVQNVYLISAGEAKKKGRAASTNPVYVVQVNNNQEVYIDASTGQTINAGAGAAVSTGAGSATVGGTVTTTPSAMPSAMPSAAPSAMPSAAPSAMPSASASAAGTVTL